MQTQTTTTTNATNKTQQTAAEVIRKTVRAGDNIATGEPVIVDMDELQFGCNMRREEEPRESI